MLLSLVAIVVCLILVIGLHEAGHALAAYLFDVEIKRISLGFGRPLFRWKTKSGCEWVWALWPLGGYVQLLNTRIEPVSEEQQQNAFDKKSSWKRLIILIAGVSVNLVVAWLAFTLIYLAGYQQKSPIIESVTAPSMAASIGLKAQDRFVAIGGCETPSWREVGMQLILGLRKKEVPIIVQNPSGERRTLVMNLSQWQYKKQKNALLAGLGIQPKLNLAAEIVPPSSILEAITKGYFQVVDSFIFFILMIKQIITGAIPFAVLLGPLAIFGAMADSVHQGMIVFLYFIATFSVTVALLNLLPIPGLDGCSILYLLIEKIRGKPVSIAFEVLLYRLSIIFFAFLFVQLLLNDFKRYLH